MAELVRLKDGGVYAVLGIRDVMELIETRIGDDVRRWMEDYLKDISVDTEDELFDLRARYHEKMAELHAESEKIAYLICEKRIDRKKLSTAAGRIGQISWREMNVY